jgi:hypothetical protein
METGARGYGQASATTGATESHPYAVDGERRPRGRGALLAVGHARGEAELAVGAGRLREVGRKGSGGPFWKIKIFFFIFFNNSPKSPIFSTKKSFSKGDPKIKVVQNFILYNIVLGYILKFQLDFKIGI